MTDEELFEFQAMAANSIVAKLNQAQRESPVTLAIELLLGRIVGAGNSLRVLRKGAPHNYAFDGAMILRGIYDAMLQALYILIDQQHRDERAQLYLDFFWIEKKRVIDLLDNSPTFLGKHVSQSPRRTNVEQAIEREIQRVWPKFLNSKGKPRSHWYEGDLRSLARSINMESEYDLLQQHLSGVVHSSPYALREGLSIPEFLLMEMAWRFAFRVLGRFAVYANVELDKHESELVRLAQENVFGDPSTHLPVNLPGRGSS